MLASLFAHAILALIWSTPKPSNETHFSERLSVTIRQLPSSSTAHTSTLQREDKTIESGKNTNRNNADPQLLFEPPKLIHIDEFELGGLEQHPEGGVIELEIAVSPEGKAAKVKIVRSTLPLIFSEQISNDFYQATFEPAKNSHVQTTGLYKARIYFSASFRPDDALEK